MKNLSLVLLATAANIAAISQITCTNASHSDTTTYTNNAPNDSLFFICQGETATLLATPPSGTSPWDFVWQSFNVNANSWSPLTTQTNQLTGTQTGLQPNGYYCSIIDANNIIVGTYIVWVVRIESNPNVDVTSIAPGCGPVSLIGQITNGTTTPYYNPPSLTDDPDAALILNANSEINICFSGTHTYVSDLAFYLVGPASCGSPTVLLSPNPGALGQGLICNDGNNINNLCFSTESTNNLNVCAGAPFSLAGTYGSYGPNSTPINWSLIYGCDAAQAGWAVQIYDCIAQDVGTLTDASLTFNGTSVGGFPVSYSFTTPPNFSDPITDAPCTANTSSIFTVPSPPATPINFTYNYIWTADPPFIIPNNTTSLNILLSPGPTVDSQFTLSLVGTNQGNLCGGADEDTEYYNFQDGEVAIINEIETEYCTLDAIAYLTANIGGGTWTGTGITSPSNGTFDPAIAGEGTHIITYTLPASCSVVSQITFEVNIPTTTFIQPVGMLCINSGIIQLVADDAGGTWTGNGIIDGENGIFDPAAAGVGTHSIGYFVSNICPITGIITIEVQDENPVTINNDNSFCINSGAFQLTADIVGGDWSGNGVSTTGIFNPAIAGVGTSIITYQVTDVCSSDDELSITVLAIPAVDAGDDAAICIGQNVQFEATGAMSYSWSPSTGLSSTNIANPIASTLNDITYTVTGTDSQGCSNTDEVSVNVYDATIVSAIAIGNNPICDGESTTLNVAGLQSMFWEPASSLDQNYIFNPNASPSVTTTYIVNGLDANGCPGNATVTVEVTEIVSNFSAMPSEGASPLQVSFVNESEFANAFDWDFGNGILLLDVGIEEDPDQTYTAGGIYTVTLVASNGVCTDTATTSVVVYFDSEIITIPNVITPDGKNGNDVFRVVSLNMEKMNVNIFNRWGNEIATITDPDGFWQPRDIENGTYFYFLKAVGFDGKIFEKEGTITLLGEK